jgi:hypothetical protein
MERQANAMTDYWREKPKDSAESLPIHYDWPCCDMLIQLSTHGSNKAVVVVVVATMPVVL